MLSHLHGDNSIAGEQRARTEKEEKVFPWDIAGGAAAEKNRKKALRRERGRKFVRSPVAVFADRKLTGKEHHGMSGDRASFPDQISLVGVCFCES